MKRFFRFIISRLFLLNFLLAIVITVVVFFRSNPVPENIYRAWEILFCSRVDRVTGKRSKRPLVST